MLKKLSLLFLLFLILGVGCKGLSQQEAAAVRPVIINYWTVFNDVSQLRKYAAEYKKKKPYVTINIRQVRYEEFEDLFVNALADDVAPDIISVHTRELPKYAARLSSMPASVRVANVSVQGQFSKETVVQPEQNPMPTYRSIQSNYVSTVADDITIGGNVYGLPLAIDTLAIYYNKDLLDRAGVATPPKTWEEFFEAVK